MNGIRNQNGDDYNMNYFNSDSYYIFGAGNTAKMVRSILEKNGKKTMSFLTSQIVSKDIDSIPVVNLSDGNKKLDHKIPVIIGVFNREANASMNFITEYLKKKIRKYYQFL